MSDGLHKLGEVLRAAREAKDVDLARVERDTKIRERYLSALEHGDYRDLPGAVYTRGFLRNYGHYLGLDPEYLIDLYRLETSALAAERPQISAPPRPIAVRRRRALVVTPSALVATILTVVVVGLVGYFGYEFWTFARTPDLRITDPAGDISSYDAMRYTVRGVTAADSRITVTNGQRENPDAQADATGAFEIELRLVPGSNVITLVAHDPVTKRDSSPVSRTINVELATQTPAPTAGVAVVTPADGARLDGPLTITGTATPGSSLTLSARPTNAAAVTFKVTDAAGRKVTVKPALPPAPDPVRATAGSDGSFTAMLPLPPGNWEITVAPASGPSVARNVIVDAPAGLSGELRVAGSASYLEIDQDGKHVAETYGHNVPADTTLTLQANETIRIRAGNAAAVSVTINGVSLGKMGGKGAVVEWRISREK